jgi:acetyltransferase-like isoleucine patch superfamily enzyme
MYAPLDDFTAAVSRLGELRSQGLLRLKVSPEGRVDFAIDKSAPDVPPPGDGLYLDIFDILSAIARGIPAEDFVATRGADEAEPHAVSRQKYEAAAAAFPARRLKPTFRSRLRARRNALIAGTLIAIGKRTGRLGRLMRLYAFRRILGPAGRRAAWCALGARIDPTAILDPGVTMRIPRNVSVGAGTRLGGRIQLESYGEVTIGRNVIMNDVDVYTAQHDVNDPGFKAERHFVRVGDYAWLPRKIILLPGVTVGSHAVIGTGSVVSRDVPDYGVAVGNPARVVKERARIHYTYVPTSVHRAPMMQ